MGGPGSGRRPSGSKQERQSKLKKKGVKGYIEDSYGERNKKAIKKLIKMRIRKAPTGHISGDVSLSSWRNKKGFKAGR